MINQHDTEPMDLEEEEEVEEDMPRMKWRELAGAINSARAVHVYVMWGPGERGEGYYKISKEEARSIVEAAKKQKPERPGEEELDAIEVAAYVEGGDLYIGPWDELDEEEEEEESDEEEDAS